MAITMNPAVFPIIAYCCSSILMTLTNKLVLSSLDFKMNFLFLAFQSIGCLILLELFTLSGLTKHRPLNKKDSQDWIIVTCALVTMIYTGSKALQYLSIPVFTIFKNLTIILIAFLERVFLSGPKVTTLIMISFMMMVLSSLVAGYSDVTEHEFNLGGYFWMFVNCGSTAMFTLMMKSTIKKVNFKDYDTVFFNNLLSIPILLVMSVLTESAEFTRTKEKYFGAKKEDASEEFGRLCMGIIISSICTFAISFSTSWCVRITGPTTYSMVGALNKLPIAILGMVFFDAVVSTASVTSIFIAFMAGGLYSYAKTLPVKSPLPTYTKVKDEE